MTDRLTYSESGVDIEKAADFVGDIGALRKRTEHRHKLHQAFGLFAAGLDISGYREPVIMTGCDGVGTKLELLLSRELYENAGKDLVAMNVNDVLTTGADPLMFLDYLGVNRIEKEPLYRLVAGMVEYLEECGCILAGGETAEMPGMVHEDIIEMSGFCVGVVEKPDIIDPTTIAEGDVLIGFPSDGPHANGFSLIRKVLREWSGEFSEEEIVSLLVPTRLYYREVEALKTAKIRPRAMAHITGGGLPENLERILGKKGVALDIPPWEHAAMQKVLAHVDPGNAPWTFNLGFGWVVIVDPADADAVLALGLGGRKLGVADNSPGVRTH